MITTKLLKAIEQVYHYSNELSIARNVRELLMVIEIEKPLGENSVECTLIRVAREICFAKIVEFDTCRDRINLALNDYRKAQKL